MKLIVKKLLQKKQKNLENFIRIQIPRSQKKK